MFFAHTVQLVRRCLLMLVLGMPLAVSAATPARPAQFHHEVYSETAAELFWLRSVDAVRGYELTRNGVVLGVFDALSYFDDSLNPGVEYVYQIRAVNFQEELSSTATLNLRTPQSADTIASLRMQIEMLQAQLNNEALAPLPRTGQANSLLPGDDGDWQVGVPLPSPRFTLNVNDVDDLNGNQACDENEICNGTVTDNLTELIWMQDVNCFGELALPDAINRMNDLAGNGSQCGVADGSQSGDWRLPNILEALSLVDFSQVFPSPTFTPENPFLNLVTFEDSGGPARYWTSTGYPDNYSNVYVSSGYTVSYGVGWVERWSAGIPAHTMAVR